MFATGCVTALAIVTALVAAYKDHRTGHIPNWLTCGSLALAPVLWFGLVAARDGASAGLSAALQSALAAVICGLMPALLFWRGGLGGGDVKLFAALGGALGLSTGMDVEFLAFAFGALWVPGRLAWDGKLLRVTGALLRSLGNPFRKKDRRLPYPPELRASLRLGPAIFLATVIATTLRSAVLGSTFG